MQNLGALMAVHKARHFGAFAGTMLLAIAQTAFGQTAAPAGNLVDNAPSEAARRAAASPYRFILQHATPRKPVPSQAPAAAPSAAAEPKKTSTPPVQQAAAQPAPAQTLRTLDPAAPVLQPEPVAAPSPAVPEPAVAAMTRRAPEPPARLEIIPVRTDEPRLPRAMLREQPKGSVKIAFDIHHDGSTRDVKVLASTNSSLNRPTVEAVQGWKFEPVDAVLTVETEVVYKFD